MTLVGINSSSTAARPEAFGSGEKVEESGRYRRPIQAEEWRSILGDLEETLSRLERSVRGLLDKRVEEGTQWLDVRMAKYCDLTFPTCEDICCNGKVVFFNQTDLIYLSSLGGFIPPGQTRTKASDPCRYLGDNRCCLPRVFRPYVCVWFLCEAQMGVFQK